MNPLKEIQRTVEEATVRRIEDLTETLERAKDVPLWVWLILFIPLPFIAVTMARLTKWVREM